VIGWLLVRDRNKELVLCSLCSVSELIAANRKERRTLSYPDLVCFVSVCLLTVYCSENKLQTNAGLLGLFVHDAISVSN
jgi:hypothetical protein